MTRVSDQWQKLTREQFVRVDDDFLATFRAPGGANKFVAWDPYERSTRYLQYVLFNCARAQPERVIAAYRSIRNRQLGSPLAVRVRGCEIDADYLAAIEEWDFLTTNGALTGAVTVVEIGAGFGRTCHTLLTLCPWIERYVIVDLAPMLELSRGYLARVLPDAPVTFVANDDHAQIAALRPDLVINIDSFQEMPPSVITYYMENLVSHAARFYCKNPVAKHTPEALGMVPPAPERLLDVLRLGYCRDTIDIFDDEQLERARQVFVDAYCPRPSDSSGPAYRVTATKPMDLFPWFLHVLYERSEARG